MTVIVNGDPRKVPSGATVADIMALVGQGIAARGVAVALNGEVVTRGEWATTAVGERDRIEVLAARGGG